MANPNASYGDILATTMQYLESEMVDNVSNNNALLFELKDKGQVKTCDGGPAIVQPIEHAENPTYKRYSGWELLDTTVSEVFTAASFPWKQIALTVSMSGLEMLQNSGKSAKFDLMEAKIKNALHTFENNFSTDLYSTGTSDGGKQIGGLQLLIPDDPTAGSVGGISRVTWSFWRPVKFGGVADGGAAVSSSNIQSYMNRLWLQICTRKETPTVAIADNTYFRMFEESLQAIQRITQQDNKMAKAGFQSYMYKSCPVVFDGGVGGACPSAHMYFVNGNYMLLRPHKDRQFTTLNPDRHAVNQDGVLKIQAWAGNLTVSAERYHGVLIA